ncbi:class I SAM-dependent methyltransferase [Patiriisocius marinus]|uniref:class I SAM-dependent methyltransferase n=1 Tax=Patiriisocius marinus TaxID=1397112 RepID=UPI00232DC3E3|nr:class I SAM-dependent methyltransferase [Patiriisocius marinus]
MKRNIDNLKKSKKPWPTKDAMEQVYEKQLWGTNATLFYSGEGSHNAEIVQPYIAYLKTFLTSFEKPLVVCDLGCGDFNVGKKLVSFTEKYIAVDIVNDLIAHNKGTFQKENLTFQCLDIAVDQLPDGDCALVRQVLQHLSNAEILNILEKLKNYRYVVLTEHVPEGDFIPNVDIISGQGTRLKKHSGINLKQAPFNLIVKEEKEVLSVIVGEGKGKIVTKLYSMF